MHVRISDRFSDQVQTTDQLKHPAYLYHTVQSDTDRFDHGYCDLHPRQS